MLTRIAVWLRRAALAALACTAGCAGEGAPPPLAAPDEQRFAADVYPLLLRDCAMSECHGSPGRFLRVVGPGRVRLSPRTEPLAPATQDEVRLSYERTRSMLAPDRQRSLLLTKPLAPSAGGASHAGVDRFGRNVYASKDDPGYAVIARWAAATGAKEAP